MSDEQQRIDDDVPIYKPAYPDAVAKCDHEHCNNETEQGERLCEQCEPIVGRDTPLLKCPYCGTERLGGRLDI